MKKKSLSIKVACEQYSKLMLEAKRLTEEAKTSKEVIIKYAREHNSEFVGKTINLDAGISVQRKENKDKVSFTPELASYEWLGSAIDNGLGDMIVLDLVAPKGKLTKKQLNLLSEIDFTTESKEDTYAVNV